MILSALTNSDLIAAIQANLETQRATVPGTIAYESACAENRALIAEAAQRNLEALA
jgi:hypothetical protein